MKKAFVTIFLFSFYLLLNASVGEIVLHPDGSLHNHNGQPIYPADLPYVYYDDIEQSIIIDGPGSEASYYDVDIISMSTLVTLISMQVNGTYDTIDVSSLPDDNYKIVITSSNYNEFEGYFTNY